MSDNIYFVAVILTVPAKNYKEAINLVLDAEPLIAKGSDIGVEVVLDYTYSPEGKRVLYLPPEDHTL